MNCVDLNSQPFDLQASSVLTAIRVLFLTLVKYTSIYTENSFTLGVGHVNTDLRRFGHIKHLQLLSLVITN